MNHRSLHLRICAVLFVSLFSSIAFAQFSAITDREDLSKSDFIDWKNHYTGELDASGNIPVDEPTPYTIVLNPASIYSDGDIPVTITQLNSAGLILQEPSEFFVDTNLPDDDFLYSTHFQSSSPNTITFSDFSGLELCGLGTQIAPSAAGPFVTHIEAFDIDGNVGSFSLNDEELTAAFVGISSAKAMSQVKISILSMEGPYLAWFAINQVDLTACTDGPGPEPLALSCEGFAAPMDQGTVKVKKNRVLPLRMELLDEGGFAFTDADLAAAPVVTVRYTSSAEGAVPIDLSDDILSVGNGSEGDQFEFIDGVWQFRLSAKNYSAEGVYVVEVVSGDAAEYIIDPSCVSSFVKE